LRLALELEIFASAARALHDLGFRLLTAAFALMVVLHYVVTYNRIRWLLSK
jgi:hypothetical protein